MFVVVFCVFIYLFTGIDARLLFQEKNEEPNEPVKGIHDLLRPVKNKWPTDGKNAHQSQSLSRGKKDAAIMQVGGHSHTARNCGHMARVGATGSSTADSQSFRGALLCFLLYCPLRVNARRCSSQAITSARTSQGKMLEKRRFEGWRAILQRQENTWKTSRHPAAGHGSRGAYKGEQACTRKVERQCTAGRFSSLAKGAGSICDGGAR